MVIQTPEGDKIECMIRLDFPTTNNEAEYEALVAGLDLAKAAGAENMIMHCDSQVITSQINGNYECRNERMKKYLEEVKSRISSLEVKFVQIPRGKRMRRPSCKSSFRRVYECIRTGIIFCPNLFAY